MKSVQHAGAEVFIQARKVKKKEEEKKQGSGPTESGVSGLENSDLMVKCSMHKLKVCHTFFG